MNDRYEALPDRADVLLCRECSTRTLGYCIPIDEVEAHDTWHAGQPAPNPTARLAIIRGEVRHE